MFSVLQLPWPILKLAMTGTLATSIQWNPSIMKQMVTFKSKLKIECLKTKRKTFFFISWLYRIYFKSCPVPIANSSPHHFPISLPFVTTATVMTLSSDLTLRAKDPRIWPRSRKRANTKLTSRPAEWSINIKVAGDSRV